MSDKDTWTIEIKGPKGIRIVTVTDEAVKAYFDPNPYISAVWLAGWAMHRETTDGN
jgi:hypothetical protein